MNPHASSSRSPQLTRRGSYRASAFHTLNVPGIADDFYHNAVDWSSSGVLACAAGTGVKVWRVGRGGDDLAEHVSGARASGEDVNLGTTGPEGVSSVSWNAGGTYLAAGNTIGHMHIVDPTTLQTTRTYSGAHGDRICALSWAGEDIISSGSRDQTIKHRDLRAPGNDPFAVSTSHDGEVCGLKWNPEASSIDGRGRLASGGNDNKVCIWDLRGSARDNTASVQNQNQNQTTGVQAPMLVLSEHTACVKALAWDPSVEGLLASGAGTTDQHIRLWKVSTGASVASIDTGSQICGLTWSRNSREILSAHGFANTLPNQVCVWRYPSLSKVAAMSGHTSRVVYLSMSPDGQSVVTGAGDGTLRFWNVFPKREKN